jgi:hypothetical protein
VSPSLEGMKPRILFVGLGENEVPVFRELARIGASAGYATRLVTHLPRLAVSVDESLAVGIGQAKRHGFGAGVEEAILSSGLPAVGYAAHYDRDWHFATWSEKRRHALAVGTALARVLEDFRPDVVVSSVGGETTRVVAGALCRARGIPTLFFNALPLRSRFVLIDRLDGPFVGPSLERDTPRPASGARGERAADVTLTGDVPPAIGEAVTRLRQTLGEARPVYPSAWLARKAIESTRRRLLLRIPHGRRRDNARPAFRILYPLHDERDFQVAVRERHAIPQAALLQYVASVLPPDAILVLKPHPQHAPDHHELLWRDVVNLPNVEMLPRTVPASQAIDESDVVLTLASSLGFEAIQAGRAVICYGRPFYSSRGLTIDVGDIRSLPEAIARARSFRPSMDDVAALTGLMLAASFPGQFTPLDGSAANIEALYLGLDARIAEQLER